MLTWFAERRKECVLDDEFDDSLDWMMADWDGEDDVCKPTLRGSLPGRKPNIERDHEGGAQRIYDDYFSDKPVFGDRLFREMI